MTKNLKSALLKLGLVACALAAFTVAVAPQAYAGNSQDVETSWYGMLAGGGLVQGGAVADPSKNGSTASTSTVVMNLSYSGSAASANVTVQTGGSNSGLCLTFYAPEGTVDTTIGSATCGQTGGTFDLGASTVSTMGQLCDLINQVAGPFTLNGNANGGAPTGGSYHCTLVGAVRSDNPNVWLPTVTEATGVNSLNAVGGWNVPVATDTIMSLGILPPAGRHVILNYCTVNSAGSSVQLQVFGSLASNGVGAASLSPFGVPGTDALNPWSSPTLSANTTTNEPLATPIATPWLEFGGQGAQYSYALNLPAGHAPVVPVGNAYNGHVVVRASNYGAGNSAQSTSNFLTCNWSLR